MNTCKGKTCDGACEAGRKYCNACLGAFRMKRKLQEERREGAGLCRRCSATAAPGDYLCPRHRANKSAQQPPTGRPVGRHQQPKGDRYAAEFKAGARPGHIARDHGVKVSLVCDALIARGLWQPRRRAA